MENYLNNLDNTTKNLYLLGDMFIQEKGIVCETWYSSAFVLSAMVHKRNILGQEVLTCLKELGLVHSCNPST